MKIIDRCLPYALLVIVVLTVGITIYNNKNNQDVMGYLGASVANSQNLSSSSSGGPCSGGKPCCNGKPYYGDERCCNGVIYSGGSWQGTNPDGSISSHQRVCCGGNVVVVGNDSRWTGTMCCQNSNTVKSYGKSQWDCSSTGVCQLNETKVCGGCANQPNPPMADYCVQYNDAYMIHTPWNSQRCAYDNPQWNSCGSGSRCNSSGTACQRKSRLILVK